MQTLVEGEKTVTENSRLEGPTGDFAVREQTRFEAHERFNGEVVALEEGHEQFLHYKTRGGAGAEADEIVHQECTLPPRIQRRGTIRHGCMRRLRRRMKLIWMESMLVYIVAGSWSICAL